ncbi:MAG TPA: hypothetical protein VE622_03155 [Nitrososphaeraceae archaeon]|jgi:hypothetical protein|nr:hypothetical protein [Nitrososphaeraceae archaeon]
MKNELPVARRMLKFIDNLFRIVQLGECELIMFERDYRNDQLLFEILSSSNGDTNNEEKKNKKKIVLIIADEYQRNKKNLS